MIFSFSFLEIKKKMPESTARSSAPPGYSALEGQYELHETGTHFIKLYTIYLKDSTKSLNDSNFKVEISLAK